MATTSACLGTLQASTRPLSTSRQWTLSSCPVRRSRGFRFLAAAGGELRVSLKADKDDVSVIGKCALIRPRPKLLCRASEGPSSPTQQEPLRPLSVVDEDGKIDAVIQVETDASPQPTWSRIYALGGGDLVVLLLFAAIGRLSHGFSVLDWDTWKTADPFIAGWLIGSYFTGGYGPEGQGLKGLKTASLAAVKSWAVGIPLALAIRGYSIGHVPPTPFIVVSLASTFVLQVGWRTAFTALLPNDDKAFQKRKGNRKGGAFEFFGLLSSLVKRW